MFIKRKYDIYFISKVESPYQLWYPILLGICRYGDDYVKSKLGVTDPIRQRDLRIEFYEKSRSSRIRTDEVEYHTLDMGNWVYPFYLYKNSADSATVFIEKGLNTLKPDPKTGAWHHPHGNPWAVIHRNDSPDEITVKLFDDDVEFGDKMKELLDEAMGW